MQELKSALFEYVMHILKEKDTSPEALGETTVSGINKDAITRPQNIKVLWRNLSEI